ncbi:Putative transcriptional regulator (partial match) [Frankia alni ACN14a]|uniref:Transcriptional regulator (Partial match) n=1 Tax=Frankia alni (strain DSM 45986 / CECT 9034 / ACN14a) TaxID=326424 RepID=Q0RJD1_FRAAA|nr:Putative transcriptional regulator (partial match) [Frankia alni ACN14a]
MTRAERERGERLGGLLRAARGERSMVEVAAAAGVSPETLRKIEAGRIATPAFFTVAALAGVLGLSLDLLADACDPAALGALDPGPAVPAPDTTREHGHSRVAAMSRPAGAPPLAASNARQRDRVPLTPSR